MNVCHAHVSNCCCQGGVISQQNNDNCWDIHWSGIDVFLHVWTYTIYIYVTSRSGGHVTLCVWSLFHTYVSNLLLMRWGHFAARKCSVVRCGAASRSGVCMCVCVWFYEFKSTPMLYLCDFVCMNSFHPQNVKCWVVVWRLNKVFLCFPVYEYIYFST